MPKSKRKKPHHCKNHAKRVARGRCPTCRKWICRECAVLYNGKFYCKDTCAPKTAAKSPSKPKKKTLPKSAAAKKTTKTEPKGSDRKPRKKQREPTQLITEGKKAAHTSPFTSILFWTAVSIGLGGIAFGLFEIRENRKLYYQVQMYKESRSRLIALVKKRNAFIRKIKGERKKAKQDIKPEKKRKKKQHTPQLYPQPTYNYLPEILPASFDNGTSSKKLIALTFDGGANKNAAEAILDTLKSRDVLATIFLTGAFIRRYPDLVRTIIAHGHEAGNHTASHPHLTSWEKTHTQTTLPGITMEMIEKELSTANTIFKNVTGSDMLPLWRAPYGEKNREICLWAQQCGYLHIGWRQARYWRHNFDTNDWIPDPETPGYYTPQETLEKFNTLADLEPYGMNGAIILMHLGTQRKEPEQQIHRVLGILIDQLRQKGYEFVPVSVLLKESGVDVSLLQNYSNVID